MASASDSKAPSKAKGWAMKEFNELMALKEGTFVGTLTESKNGKSITATFTNNKVLASFTFFNGKKANTQVHVDVVDAPGFDLVLINKRMTELVGMTNGTIEDLKWAFGDQ